MLFQRIKELCNNKKITINELEKTLGFGNGTIRSWNSSSPSVIKAKAVADYFGVGVDYLINNEKALSEKALETAKKFDSFTQDQQNLIICYMSVIEKG